MFLGCLWPILRPLITPSRASVETVTKQLGSRVVAAEARTRDLERELSASRTENTRLEEEASARLMSVHQCRTGTGAGAALVLVLH